jgi:high affinity Mn2+ porin
MNWQINKANSNNLEYTHHFKIGGQQGAIRLLSYLNIAPMGNYEQAIKLSSSTDPPVDFNGANNALNENGHTKYGFCLNIEQDINENLGCFIRAGWNDGRNESWEYTEIDRTASIGISSTGSKWKRKDDNVGLAYVVSGLSAPHREYLKDGGMGFILGDGNLNYGLENLAEVYYSFALSKHLFLSGAYQFILNPGYNMDRGPVNVFSVRLHTSI